MVIEKGLALGYRKSSAGSAWIVRRYDPLTRKNAESRLAKADDNRDADGIEVLTFSQAQRLVMADTKHKAEAAAGKHYTVADAVADYVAWAKDNNKSGDDTEAKLRAYVLESDLADKRLGDLTPADMDTWLSWALKRPRRFKAKTLPTPTPRAFKKPRPPKPEKRKADIPALSTDELRRRRRSTVNRIITPVKAMLNHAKSRRKIATDDAWAKLGKFARVDSARLRWLTEAEAVRLLNASAPDFRKFAQGALMSGCGPGELARAEARDFDPHSKTLLVTDKTRPPRRVPLTDDGVALFESLTAGLGGHDLIFMQSDGRPWKKIDWVRAINGACGAAKISPPATFYTLRHTYASHLVQKGTPLMFVATTLGHKDTRMVEKHYGHFAHSHVAESIRERLPSFGITVDKKVQALKPK
ncbi:MAG TPA: site-specific integrase [Povalibacter sp.]|uniref:tyrosine-type recombinase/integrase n=1 Tax=Povalibacter sp. TaxID=1962978 RepID=UPI002CBA2A7F|nr:site-specific integrase [Povalibacter sp.]HMN42950.1 site-specific integrase [Povalibacter sp.]